MVLQLEQAMGGTEALDFLANSQTFPDLILLDVMMPDMSGYEVCEEIRRVYNAPIPIIMVSAKGNPEDIAKGLEMGANDYVKKPFHRQEVRDRGDSMSSEVNHLTFSILPTQLLSRVKAHIRNRVYRSNGELIESGSGPGP